MFTLAYKTVDVKGNDSHVLTHWNCLFSNVLLKYERENYLIPANFRIQQ